MPFDLRLHSIPLGGGQVWSMEGPSWLDRPRTLPVPREAVREFTDAATWQRDRYLIVSRAELINWHEEIWPPARLREGLEPRTRAKLAEFEAEVLRQGGAPLYLMHWFEWESGMN